MSEPAPILAKAFSRGGRVACRDVGGQSVATSSLCSELAVFLLALRLVITSEDLRTV